MLMYENENQKNKQTNEQNQSKNEIEFIVKTKLQTRKNGDSRASE